MLPWAARTGSIRSACTALVAVALWLGSEPARAQAGAQEKAAAEALFDEGRSLLGQGDFQSACQRFEQSQAIDPGVGTLLYLADCYERIDRLASAWATFREASSAAQASGQADRARIADERARKLAPRLSRVALVVPEANRSAGFELLLDGKLISSALYGVSFPIDSGKHQLTARAPGMTPWQSVLEIAGNGDRSSIQIPALTRAALETPPAQQSPMAARDAQSSPGGGDEQQLIGIVVGSAGLVAVGVGAVFGVRAADKDSQAEEGCRGSECLTRTAAGLNEDARSSALIANVSYGVGIAALITGAVLYFTADSEAERALAPSASRWSVAPLPGRARGLSVSGSF